MAKEICISTTPHETRLAILEDDQLAEIYYERENEYTLAGSIYKGRVTRVLPGMQSAFVDIGLERDAFLYVTDFLEDSDDSEEYEGTSGRGREPRVRSADDPGAESTSDSREEARSRGDRSGDRGGDRGSRNRREQHAPRPAVQAQPAERLERPRRVAVEVQPMPEEAELSAGLAEKGDDEESTGTRRWRGRRGRRRGLRGAPLEREPQADLSADASPEQQDTADLLDTPEYGAPGGIASLHGAAEAAEVTGAEARTRAPRLPRGFGGPSRIAAFPDAHEVASETAPSFSKPASTPGAIVLPGESISKYGGTPAPAAPRSQGAAPAPAARAATVSSFKPATLVEVSADWDGGAVLPGESLSRYRAAAPVQAAAIPVSEGAGPEVETGSVANRVEEVVDIAASVEEPIREAEYEPKADADELRSGQEQSGELPVSSSEPTHSAEPEAHAGAAAGALAEPEIVAEALSEPAAEHAAEVEHETEGERPAGAEPQPGSPHEYEPENASASYRVDPGSASELRIPGLSNLTAALGFGPREAAAEEAHDAHSAAAAVTEARSTDHGHGEDLHVEEAHVPSEEVPSFSEEAHQEDHRLSPAAEAQQRDAEAAFSTDGQNAAAPQGFAPGLGLLEEELIDEEEYEFSPIEVHREDDLDDLEEETLDHHHEFQVEAAVLGDAVRDSHLSMRLSQTAEPEEVEAEDDEEEGYEEEESEEGEEQEPVRLEPAPGVERQLPSRREGREDRGRSNGRGGRGGRGNSNGDGRGRRASSQLSNVPVISELLKQGQEILVQIAKEPIAKKGARITSHIALPGRFLVFMPTVNHVGVSRKISSDEERQRLKHILISEKGDFSGGFIVRTAADGASEEDLRADLRFLINLWSEIKQRSDSGKAPALIYHDLNLIERILRDQVSSNFSTIWVDSEAEYERILRFLNRFQPQLVRRVKLYTKETPLFEQFGIQDEITKALKSKVWLKSGGSIVINQTEALVAIDINTGKYVGKTARLEDTIVKTNLDAIPEIVRQIRLRDLGGIIVIDFIDMDDRRNRNKVLAALEEALKADRAPSKVLQFNDFGLVAITRKRVKQSLERTLSVQCETCSGTGMVKSPTTVCNEIWIEMRKMQKHFERGDVMLRVNPEVVKALKHNNGKWIMELEEMISKTIIIKSDPALHPEQFDIH